MGLRRGQKKESSITSGTRELIEEQEALKAKKDQCKMQAELLEVDARYRVEDKEINIFSEMEMPGFRRLQRHKQHYRVQTSSNSKEQ